MADLPPSEVAYEEAHLSDDRGPLVVGVSGLLMGVVVVIVSLRFIARRTRHMPLLTDDWLALVGMVSESPGALRRPNRILIQFKCRS